MSPPQADDHVKLYNRLPFIPDAYNILRQELAAAGIQVPGDDPMLPILWDPEVYALFRDEENQGRSFGIWIVHRHFELSPGERMVALGNLSKPALGNPTQVAERWDHNGNEIEFMQPGADEASHMAPSPSLLKTFRDLMRDKFGVSILGLCRTPPKLGVGRVYVETTDEARRAQIVKVVNRDELLGEDSVYPSSWVPHSDSAGARMYCNCGCKVCSLTNVILDDGPDVLPIPIIEASL